MHGNPDEGVFRHPYATHLDRSVLLATLARGEGEGIGPAPEAARCDPLWDDWEVPPRVPGAPELHLDGFDGPIDLLLDLAERQRIDLGRVSVADLAEQFVAALARLSSHVPIERRADWVVMASRLVLLRSRLLFPASPEEAAKAERDAAAELRRLEAMAVLRAAGAWLQTRKQLGIDVFGRPQPVPPREAGYVALMEACLAVLRGREGRADAAPVYRPVIPAVWRVPDALARVRALLAAHPAGGTLGRFLPPLGPDDPDHLLKSRAAVASTLVAGLELARDGAAHLEQAEAFGPIHMTAVEHQQAHRPEAVPA
jgi:segregation and condensation protein A